MQGQFRRFQVFVWAFFATIRSAPHRAGCDAGHGCCLLDAGAFPGKHFDKFYPGAARGELSEPIKPASVFGCGHPHVRILGGGGLKTRKMDIPPSKIFRFCIEGGSEVARIKTWAVLKREHIIERQLPVSQFFN
jgi:hypothetical protein